MAEEELELTDVEIVPLTKQMARGCFVNEDKEFSHLPNFFKTAAFKAQQERKSKTYVALIVEKVVGYITIAMISIERLDGVKNTTQFFHQVLNIGKLYVDEKYRSQGVGAKLVSIAIGIAVSVDDLCGCIGVHVDSNSNPKTVKFYEKFGFMKIDHTEDDAAQTIGMFLQIREK